MRARHQRPTSFGGALMLARIGTVAYTHRDSRLTELLQDGLVVSIVLPLKRGRPPATPIRPSRRAARRLLSGC
jgi:hypothetical protein